jgi:hypothetical protein
MLKARRPPGCAPRRDGLTRSMCAARMRRPDAPLGCAVRMRRPPEVRAVRLGCAYPLEARGPAAEARRVRLPTRGPRPGGGAVQRRARHPLSRPLGRARLQVAGGVGSGAASGRGRLRVVGGFGWWAASVRGGFESSAGPGRACRTVEVPQIEGCRLTALPARNRFTWVRLPRRAGCESPLAVGGGGDHAAGRSGGMLNGWCGGVALRLGLRHVGAVTVDRRAPGALKGGVRWRPEGLLRGLSAVQPRARCPSWPVAPDQPPVCRDRFWVDTPDG